MAEGWVFLQVKEAPKGLKPLKPAAGVLLPSQELEINLKSLKLPCQYNFKYAWTEKISLSGAACLVLIALTAW